MAVNELTPKDHELIHLGYRARLSAADTCNALNQSRNPGEYLLPSVVTYQYTKLKAKGTEPLSPTEVLSYIPHSTLDTPPLDTAQTTPTSALDLALDQVEEFK